MNGRKKKFHGENFHWLLAGVVAKDAVPPNFAEKTFVNSYIVQNLQIRKSFLPQSFPAIRYVTKGA